jgi:hypothetical protein
VHNEHVRSVVIDMLYKQRFNIWGCIYIICIGTILSGLCWDSIDHIEREARSLQTAAKQTSCKAPTQTLAGILSDPFAPALSILRLLLYGVPDAVATPLVDSSKNHLSQQQVQYMPFCSRRRGRYFERLCIDLEHSGRPEEALRTCREAVHSLVAGVKVS